MPQHIKRLVATFAVFIVLFLILQHILKPTTFGDLGHFRAKSIEENSIRPLNYAGSENCKNCHDSLRMDKANGFHAILKCEVCHGPGLKHALYAGQFKGKQLPDSLMLHKPTERKECAICHQKNAARTKILFDTLDHSMIRQVDAMKHKLIDKKTGLERKCIVCHNPHQP